MMTRVGFIGLGAMGMPMAGHLMRKGYHLSVFARRAETLAPLVAGGAFLCTSPKEVAARSEIVLTMVTADSDVRQVVLGSAGVIEGGRRGNILVDMSTIAPSTAREIAGQLAGAGIEMLDAPVSGGPMGAQDGSLSIMVGGREKTFRQALPIFECLGKRIVHVGPGGAGQVAKACNQTLLLITLQGLAEAFSFARRNSVNLEKVYQALAGGSAQSRILEVMGQRMVERNYTPGVEARLHHKDLGIVMQEAHGAGLMLPGLAQVTQMFNALMNRGGGREDSSQLIEVIGTLTTGDPQAHLGARRHNEG